MNDTARPKFEVADIINQYGKEYQRDNALSFEQIKVMQHITSCRTADLGGHVERCESCGFENKRIS